MKLEAVNEKLGLDDREVPKFARSVSVLAVSWRSNTLFEQDVTLSQSV